MAMRCTNGASLKGLVLSLAPPSEHGYFPAAPPGYTFVGAGTAEGTTGSSLSS